MKKNYGYFMAPQNFSVNDGDGIRTTIFFAGCPLRCKWCANPEGLENVNKVSFNAGSCIGCGKCTLNCYMNVDINLNLAEEREKCTSCGKCIEVCPTNSRRKLVKQYTVGELLEIIEKQEIFFKYSNGGVTFSGGEATMQQDMLRELVNKLYDKAINLAIETSGYFEFHEIMDILQKIDLIFIDIKHMDEDKHLMFTGKSNKKILENMKRLHELNNDVVVRLPLIEGVNASEENIINTARFVKQHIPNPKIELLTYHNFGDEKYEALGIKKPSREFKRPSEDRLNNIKSLIKIEGVELVSYK